MVTALLDAGVRGAVVALALLLAAVLLRDRPRLAAARIGAAMALGLAVQAIGSAPFVEATMSRLGQAPLVAVAVGNAVVFWIVVQALFDDDFAFRPVHAIAWLGAAALGFFNCGFGLGSGGPLAATTALLQRAVPLLFAALAAWAAVSNWRSDLLEGRRRLRGFVIVTGVVYSLAQLAARVASPQGRFSAATASADSLALLAMLAVVAVHIVRVSGDALFAAAPERRPDGPADLTPAADAAMATTPPRADPADDRLAEALAQAMAEGAYRDDGLSIAGLASRLAVPEYRLRRVINRRLGHRNFNAYVNGFRIAEARAALADPGRRDTSVLSIALDAGFQSVGPFNRAFKATTGQTPTEFRRAGQADS